MCIFRQPAPQQTVTQGFAGTANNYAATIAPSAPAPVALPTVPQAPTDPGPAPTVADQDAAAAAKKAKAALDVQQQAEQERQQLKASQRGIASTILTAGFGLIGKAKTKGVTLGGY